MPAISSLLAIAAIGAVLFMGRKKGPKPEPPPPPAAPVGKPEIGEAEATKEKRLVKGGRQGTILTGQLTPENIGKKRLLGGTP